MPVKAHPYTNIYNTIEKVEAYWDGLKPPAASAASYGEKWLSHAPLFDQISARSCVFITLWDVVISDRFLYATDKRKVVGYDASLFMAEDGIDFSMANYHPDHLRANLLMQQTAFQYCVDHPGTPSDKIIINADLLYKKKDGIYINLLQQAVAVESDDSGHPLLFLSHLYDITHLKKHSSANLVITEPTGVQMWNYDFDKKCLELIKPPSFQERRILDLLCKGKPTKEIADVLSISHYTVDTHRRHLLHKTNCKDTTGLVTYARMVGLI